MRQEREVRDLSGTVGLEVSAFAMAMNHPGVGDPLGVSNPYADGRPNWNLQSKSHAQGPPDHLRSGAVGVVGSQALRSPFAQDFPDKYVVPCPREPERQGMKHFDSHLARTTRERVEGGLGIPNTIRSGYDRPERGTGRRPLEPVQHWDPKDGGIWAPVKREYPKVPRREVHEGVHICERPVNKDRPVDIWPATITVQDPFKPGGLKMFPGKRNTDKDAFPNAIGYTPPDPKIDYSTVENGGPFGVKKLHKNEPVPLPEGYQARYLADSTTKSKSLAELGESNKALAHATSGPQTRHGDIFPFRPSSAARRRAAEQAWGAKPPSQPSSRQASRPPSERGGGTPFSAAGATQVFAQAEQKPRSRLPSSQSQQEPIHMPPPPSYGRRAGSAAPSPAPMPQVQAVETFNPRGKLSHEFPLTHSTKWTFVGGFRP